MELSISLSCVISVDVLARVVHEQALRVAFWRGPRGIQIEDTGNDSHGKQSRCAFGIGIFKSVYVSLWGRRMLHCLQVLAEEARHLRIADQGLLLRAHVGVC